MKTNPGRNKVFELLGTKLTNSRWSWSAISADHRRAVFTVWEDEMCDGKSPLLKNYDAATSRGEKAQKGIIDLVMAHDIPVFGLVCTKNPTTVKGDHLIKLQIVKDSDGVHGKHGERVLMAQLFADRYSSNNGLLDLESAPLGNHTPDRALTSGWTVIRDNKVRAYVIGLADGKCEYCGKEGFLMSNDKRYIEAHHIIALSAKGCDVVENVIGLCPEHHREAHYGIGAEKLEEEFVKSILARPKNREAQ